MVIEPGEERCKAPLIGALKRGSLAMTQSVSSWRVGAITANSAPSVYVFSDGLFGTGWRRSG